MNNKVLFSILILTFVYDVTCNDDEEVKQRGLNRARQHYRYNHPPETEEVIPVAIVYDKVIDRNTGAKFVTETNNVTSIPETGLNNTEIKNYVKTISSESFNSSKLASGNERNPESRNIKLEIKIPVSVVYDDASGNARNRIKSGVGTRLRKPVKSQRKPNNQEKDQTITASKAQPDKGKLETGLENFEKSTPGEKNIINTKANSTILRSEFANRDMPSRRNSSIISNEKSNEKKRQNGDPDPIVPIVSSENHVFGHNGEFQYSYEGGDGTKAFSNGKLKTFEEDVAGEAVEGGFSYKDKEGNDFSLSYTADENGYRPVGAHLPTPPPIPPAIARALAYLATKPTPEPVTEATDEELSPAPLKKKLN